MEQVIKYGSIILNKDGIAGHIFFSVLLLIAGIIVVKLVMKIVAKALSHSPLDAVLHTFIINCLKIICYIFLVITVLGQLGVPMSAFITMIGACGAAVALALKDSLSNFAGGILILLNQPFKQGDYIEINGVSGKVEKIDLLYSNLKTLDNKVVIVPNGVIANQTVTNYSDQNIRRIDCRFGISYDSSIDRAKEIIENVIKNSDYFIDSENTIIGVSDHGDSAVYIDAFVWCRTDDFFPARYYLMETVKKEFDNNGIEIPFPQVTVHYASGSEEAEQN